MRRMLDETHPALCREWSPRNEMSPHDVSHGSAIRVWWVCDKGHEWQAFVYNRATANGTGCPACTSVGVRKLVPGFNDFATKYPDLAREWHPTKNDFGPDQVSSGSRKRVWWLCHECGREWNAVIKNRTTRGTGCPACRGRLRGLKNKGNGFPPHLISEWSPKNEHPITFYSLSSNHTAWWVCEKGHEWQANIQWRTDSESGCPKCSGRLVDVGRNDLSTTRPGLVHQWHPTKNGTLTPKDVSFGSSKKVWWLCPEGHETQAVVWSRSSGKGCSTCSGHNHPLVLGENDLETLSPEIADEWHPTKNGSLTPRDVTRASGRRVWWMCKKGHEWETCVYTRARGAGCPKCSNNGTSKAEQDVYAYVHSICPDAVFHDRTVSGRYEYDVSVPSRHVAIEYNGLYWHSDQFKTKNYHRDKAQAAEEEGWQVIQVWEDDWLYRRGVVKVMLTRKLGVSKEPRLNARSLLVREVDTISAREFLNVHHIQGYAPGSVRIGLYQPDGTLQAIMLFKHRGGGTNTYELSRYATSAIVRGGFSKLFTHFLREYSPDKVISFSDMSISDGSLYRNCGFAQDGILAPDYSYVVGDRRIHKFNYRLKRFREDPELRFEKGKTERELAELNGLHRVYDSGKVRWVWYNRS